MVKTLTKLGTNSGVFTGASDDIKAIGTDLRDLIVGLHPETVEVPRAGDRATAYGFGEKKMSESYCYIAPKKAHVNLGFWWGTSLEDHDKLLEGTGKKLRHVKVRDQVTARDDKIASLVQSSIEERRQGLGIEG